MSAIPTSSRRHTPESAVRAFLMEQYEPVTTAEVMAATGLRKSTTRRALYNAAIPVNVGSARLLWVSP